jgi:signal peptidase II
LRRYVQLGGIAALSLGLDILTKFLIESNLMEGERIDFLGGFFRLTLTYNEGGVFGILQGYQHLFLVVSILVLILLIGFYIFEKEKTLLFTLSMGLIMGGALGNIIDRIMPQRRGVVDFISVGVDSVYRWPTFNIADSSIVVGAGLLILIFIREERRLRKGA